MRKIAVSVISSALLVVGAAPAFADYPVPFTPAEVVVPKEVVVVLPPPAAVTAVIATNKVQAVIEQQKAAVQSAPDVVAPVKVIVVGNVLVPSLVYSQKTTDAFENIDDTAKNKLVGTVTSTDTLKLGKKVAPVVSNLPADTEVRVKMIVNGREIIVGTTTTDANGVAQMPALNIKKPGTYTVYLVNPANGARIKYVFTVK